MTFPRRLILFLALTWVLVVLYPDPLVLARSVRNVVQPRIQPQAVAVVARTLPDDPRAIEAFVLDRAVPYAYDWQAAGVPWYFPTTSEVLRAGRGDCESRALLLASLLEAKGIPYELRVSLDHMWVDYPGKQENAIENADVELAGRRDGRFFLHWPADFDLGQEARYQLAVYWDPAPPARLALLGIGLLLIPLWNVLARAAAGPGARRARRAAPPFAARPQRV